MSGSKIGNISMLPDMSIVDTLDSLQKENEALKTQIKYRDKVFNTMMKTIGDCNEDSKNMTVDWKMGAIWVYHNIECAIEDARNELLEVGENSEGVWLAGEGTFVGEAINQGEPMTFEDENE